MRRGNGTAGELTLTDATSIRHRRPQLLRAGSARTTGRWCLYPVSTTASSRPASVQFPRGIALSSPGATMTVTSRASARRGFACAYQSSNAAPSILQYRYAAPAGFTASGASRCQVTSDDSGPRAQSFQAESIALRFFFQWSMMCRKTGFHFSGSCSLIRAAPRRRCGRRSGPHW